ncbi:hypothetical protein EW146_g4231 [Bondarzewia mesenterica]|uniref:N-acetyltransferase domain-containing protein n=1 Tax=Bondarzewia mesenterica TaxID=1095465 RepID=A0A4S4LWA3_9AGAM|nr:hypothetical protein EW146_g4231 [Bondarzewia mesenterica]
MEGLRPPAHELVVLSPTHPEDVDDDGDPEARASLKLRLQCYAVRISVFVHEQRFPLDVEIDAIDATATHFLLRLVPSLEPIGTIRAYRPPGATHYKLSRLAVLKEHRRFRFGRALVLALHEWVRNDARAHASQGLVTVVSHSQIPVKGFYAKFGYTPESQGEEFDEDGAPHQKMIARLPLSD